MNTYSIADAAGVVHALAPGMDFTSFVQRVDTAKESADLKAPIGAYVAEAVQIPYAALDGYDDQLLARWKITRAVVEDPPPPPVTEVPMYRVKIVLDQQGLTGAVTSYIAGLTGLQKTVALDLWNDAPNLEVQGDFALQVKAALGLSDAQYQALVDAALAITF